MLYRNYKLESKLTVCISDRLDAKYSGLRNVLFNNVKQINDIGLVFILKFLEIKVNIDI